MEENFDDVEKQIIELLNKFFMEVKEKKYSGDKIWTSRLKEEIGDLGIMLGSKVSIGGFPDKFESEWLYDVVWYLENSDGFLRRISLIVESEWNKNYTDIKYDFEKLLIGNAERRLMICQWRGDDIDNLFEKFKKAIDTFEENYGDRFLFAVLDSQTESKFFYKTFTKTKL